MPDCKVNGFFFSFFFLFFLTTTTNDFYYQLQSFFIFSFYCEGVRGCEFELEVIDLGQRGLGTKGVRFEEREKTFSNIESLKRQ